jgi:hypothetical protein
MIIGYIFIASGVAIHYYLEKKKAIIYLTNPIVKNILTVSYVLYIIYNRNGGYGG